MAMTKQERAEARAKAQKEARAKAATKRKTKAKAPKAASLATASDAVKVSDNMPPTLRLNSELQEAFEYFNRELFGGKLENVILSNVRLKKALGYFWAKQWARRKEAKGNTHEIGLDFTRLYGKTDLDLLAVLVHEQCHLQIEQEGLSPKRAYHCKNWVERMKAVGLTPIILDKHGKPTGKATGPNSSHSIDEGGPFDVAARKLLENGWLFSWHAIPVPEKPKSEKKKKAGAKAKHECPSCGAAAWGKPTLHIGCRDCDVQMICADAENYEGGDDAE